MTWPPAGMVGEDGGSRLIFIVLGTAACKRNSNTRYTNKFCSHLEDEVLDGGAGEVVGE